MEIITTIINAITFVLLILLWLKINSPDNN